MSSHSLRAGWISRRDICSLDWPLSEKTRALKEVKSSESGDSRFGVIRSLADLNSWAVANGLRPIEVDSLIRELDKIKAKQRAKTKPKKSYPPLTDRQIAAEASKAKGLWFRHLSEANRFGFVSAKQLEARLWTPTLIEKLLGEPEAFGTNPYGGRNAMRFWSVGSVAALEESQRFTDEMSKSIRRRKISWERALASIAASDRKIYGSSHATCGGWLRVFGKI